MTRRLLALGALAVLPLAAQPSGASFTAASTNAPSTFAAAADFNTVSVSLADPGSPLRGTVNLTTTAGSDRGIARVRFQVAAAGSGSWSDVCVDTDAPYACAWNTAGADGQRDVRALAQDTAGHERAAVRANRLVDTTAPALSLTHPGTTTVKGTLTLTVTATDGGSGIGAGGIAVQWKPSGGATWTDICTRASSGTCDWDSTARPDGSYDLRSTAVDAAGNAATPVVLASRHVDNSVPTATVADAPPSNASGTVSMTIDTGGAGDVEKVVFEARPTNTTTWYPVCTDTQAPYTCAADSKAYNAPDGEYDIRGVIYDMSGNTTPSATFTFRLDNTAPRGQDVQGTNGGAPGRLDSGDRLTLTYTEAMRAATVASGWDGAAPLPVKVRVANAAAADTLTVWDDANAAQLGLATSIGLDRDVTSDGATFAGTLTRVSDAQYQLTLGALNSGSVTTAAVSATLRWIPSAAAKDLAGNAAATTLTTETGAGDADL
jgi:hypothetical protein